MSDKAMRDDGFDVLESIRRLVSDTPPARRDLGEAREQGKLLLTPALRVEETGQAEDDTGPLPVAEAGWSLEARIAELEAAVGSAPGEWEPDGSEDADQETPRRFVFQHRPLPLSGREADRAAFAARAAEIASAEAPELDEAEPSPDEPEIDFTEDTPLPDPEALRDLVAEIVRQELQGELGMRVTRNIRKLVRREIQRALMSKDFDD